MALTTTTKKTAGTAQGAAPEATNSSITKSDASATDAKTETLETNEVGQAINTGDANAKPAELNQPVTPQAIENDATPKQEAEVENAAARERALAKAEETGETVKKSDVQEHILVQNRKTISFRQPSTGKWIEAGGEAYLLNDGWLKNQIAAKLLKKVKED